MTDLTVEMLVACEKVSVGTGGVPVLERAFTYIERESFPFDLTFALYAEIWGPQFATVRVHAQVEGPDGEVVAHRAPEGVAFDEDGVALFALPFEQVALPGPGVYTASFLADGRVLAARRFCVARPWSRSTQTGSLAESRGPDLPAADAPNAPRTPGQRTNAPVSRELTVEMFAPCEGSSVTQDHRVTVRGPFGRVGVKSLPAIHPVMALPIVIWGPPHARAEIRVRLERPGEPVDAEVGPPTAIMFDGSGICGVAASLERVLLRTEGVHALAVLAEGRVLARRRFTVQVLPSWEWPQGAIPGGA